MRGDTDELPALIPQLMSAAVMPYWGSRPPSRSSTAAQIRPTGIVALWPQTPADTPVEPRATEYPPELARLPPGRHGLPREFVAHNQRERLIAGLAEAVAENGYAGTTIAHITRHAAVSRRTFYEHFASKDECFVAAYDTVMAELRERVGAGLRGGGRLAARGQGRDRRDARASSPPSPTSPASAWSRRWSPARSSSSATTPPSRASSPTSRRGREGRSPEVLARLSPTTEEALVGGMISLISRRIIAGKTAELESLLPDLVEFTLTPYLGSDEAAKIAREG